MRVVALDRSLSSVTAITVMAAVFAVFGCGGGGGGSGGGTLASEAAVVQGVASKGPLSNSRVCAYAITNGFQGDQLGDCSTTDSSGKYSIKIAAYGGPLLIVAADGTYADEATGQAVSLSLPLHSVLSSANGGSSAVAVTALTELAYQLAKGRPGGLTEANTQSSIATVQDSFGVADIVTTMPVDALSVPASASRAQLAYALALATISQYSQGGTTGADLVRAMSSIQNCLADPSANCGSGRGSVGQSLTSALDVFVARNPTFAGIPLRVSKLESVTGSGSGSSGNGGGSGNPGQGSSGGSRMGARTITLNITGTRLEKVFMLDGPEHTCRFSCQIVVPVDVNVQLAVDPNCPSGGDCWRWAPRWSGDCQANGYSCAVPMDGDRAVNVSLDGEMEGAYKIYLHGSYKYKDGSVTNFQYLELDGIRLVNNDLDRKYRVTGGATGTVSPITSTSGWSATGPFDLGISGQPGCTADAAWGNRGEILWISPVNVPGIARAFFDTQAIGGNEEPPQTPRPSDGVNVYGTGDFSCPPDDAGVSMQGSWQAYRIGP